MIISPPKFQNGQEAEISTSPGKPIGGLQELVVRFKFISEFQSRRSGLPRLRNRCVECAQCSVFVFLFSISTKETRV